MSPLQYTPLGNPLLAWATALGGALAVLIALVLLRRIGLRKLARFAERTPTEWDDLLVAVLKSTRFFTLAAIAVSAGAQALVNLGQGGVSVIAGGDILGGRLDVAAGNATLQAGGSLASAGQVSGETAANTFVAVPDTLRIRLSDGTVNIQARGAAAMCSKPNSNKSRAGTMRSRFRFTGGAPRFSIFTICHSQSRSASG